MYEENEVLVPNLVGVSGLKLNQWRVEHNYGLEVMEEAIKSLASSLCDFQEADWFYDLTITDWTIDSLISVFNIVKECKDRSKLENRLSEYFFANENDMNTLEYAWSELYDKYGDGALTLVKQEMTSLVTQ